MHDGLISTFLEREHAAILSALAELECRVVERMMPGAKQSLGRLTRLLDHHMILEEKILFDALAAMPKGTEARIGNLHHEHRHIHELTVQAAGFLESGSPELAAAVVCDLREYIQLHDERELREIEALMGELTDAERVLVHTRLSSLESPGPDAVRPDIYPGGH